MTVSPTTVSDRLAALARRRAGERSESGFVLMIVLGAIALTSVVVIALLGLAMTSARATAAQRDAAREQRVAANALEVAIGEVGRIEEPDPCEAWPGLQPTSLDLEDRQIQVDCHSTPFVPPGGPPLAVSQPALESMDVARPHRFPMIGPEGNISFETTWSASGATPISSLYLLLQTDEGENVHNLNRTIAATLTLAAANGGGSCTTDVTGGRTNEWDDAFTSIDLLESGSCRSLIEGKPRSVLDGAKIRVRHSYRPADVGCVPLCSARLRVNEVRLLADVVVVEGTSASTDGRWLNPQRAVTLDGSAAEANQSGGCSVEILPGVFLPLGLRCRHEVPGTTFTLSVTDLDTSALDADGDLQNVGVLISARRKTNWDPNSWISDPIDETWFEVELSAAERSCVVRNDGFARSNQQVWVDLLDEPTCREQFSKVEDLEGAAITYSVLVNCAHDHEGRPAGVGPDGRCGSVTVPDLDRLALGVVTVPEPDTAILTLTASVDGQAVAEADVYLNGDTEVPRPTPITAWRYCREGHCLGVADSSDP